jgi:hypothetical protein
MEDKVVELKRFIKISDAEMLANLLRSEGIDCYVRDLYMNQIYGGVDFGGVKVELLEKDLQRAQEIMKDYGYLSSGNDNEDADISENENEDGDISENDNDDEGISENENEDEEDADLLEFDNEMQRYKADKARRKAKLSRTMTILCVLLILFYFIMFFYNKYLNG